MPDRAHITSVEALETFRSSLIVYLSKARPALDEVGADLLRIRLWLQNDQRRHWEREARRRAKALEQAQQALFSARLSDPHESTDSEQVAVRRARRALEEAEEKLRYLKKWSRDFDSRIEPLAKQLDQLRDLLAIDMPQAVAYLGSAIKTLAEYAGIAPAQPPPGSSPPEGSGASSAPEVSS